MRVKITLTSSFETVLKDLLRMRAIIMLTSS
jgi:hypothetical protein